MKKVSNQINNSWQYHFEEAGFDYHSLSGKYWIDNYHLELKQEEANAMELAANEVHAMCIEMVSENIRKGNFEKYGLNRFVISAMERSWKNKDFHLYGRFDFAFDGTGNPKMLEYNADTPTSIVETAIAQNVWKKMQWEEFGVQYNMINRLEEAFKNRFKIWQSLNEGKNFYFAADELVIEDWGNVLALMNWAKDVGIDAKSIDFQDILYSTNKLEFQNQEGQRIDTLFKLYPWEFIFNEFNFGDYEVSTTQMVEPMWKGLLSTKAILPMLWDMFKGHKNLMPAFFNEEEMLKVSKSYVKKPIYSREGANIEVIRDNSIIDTADGDYGAEGHIYQEYAKMASIDNAWYVFGTWIIGDKMEGLSVREDKTVITKNTSLFVPHNIV